MLRLLSFAVITAALVAGSVWLADRPGQVLVEWLGWRIETSVPVLLLALLIVGALLSFSLRLVIGLLRLPGHWIEACRVRRQRKGYQALSDGLAAAVSSDAKRAAKLAGKARKLLADPALTAFLSAQSAKLAGDGDKAREHYTAMLERPETAALGLRGLMDQALAHGDELGAIELGERARLASPADPWLAERLFGLLLKHGKLSQAQTLLADAKRRKAVQGPRLARFTALAHTAQAMASDDKISFSKKALAADPGLSQAAVLLAQGYAAAGKIKQASAVLAKAWARHPDPALLEAAAALQPDEDALNRLRRLEKLLATRSEDASGQLTLAQAALTAKVWGQARKHLLLAQALRPTTQVYRLLAQLERAEYKNEDAARAWEAKIAEAQPDAVWLCGDCGGKSKAWELFCPHCGALDGLEFTVPKLSA